MAKARHGMCVLETKEPNLPQTDCLRNLIKELLTHRLMDRELQLRAHHSHPDSWNYSKVTGRPWFDMAHKGPVLKKA